MLPIIEFFIKNIYCAPKQDSQFSFALIKANSKPARGSTFIYNVVKRLPNATEGFDVYILGNLSPKYVGLLRQNRDWYRDSWINVAEDMALRNYIMHAYDGTGMMVNRSKVYYNFIDEGSLIFAVQRDIRAPEVTTGKLYIHFYSNSWFETSEFSSQLPSIGIDYVSSIVNTNVDKVVLQNWISSRESNAGKCFVYVDGVYHDRVTLDIPNYSTVEVVYDQSVISKEYVPISSLRQFTSIKFTGTRYLLTRNKILDEIEYYDDTEVYITTGTKSNNRGVFYYKHTADSMYMGTDKDYTFNSQYINNSANHVSTLYGGATQDKLVALHIRKSGVPRPLMYSDMRLHELYKLPLDKQLDVLDASGSSITDLRVEHIENSMYFTLASSSDPFSMTKEAVAQAIGYNAVSYYFGFNVVETSSSNAIDVPELYQEPSTAYEYDFDGKMIGHYSTSGNIYICNNQTTRYVEFIKGVTPIVYNSYHLPDEQINLNYNDYVVLSATFVDLTKVSPWQDITYTAKVQRLPSDKIQLQETVGNKVCVIYLNEPNLYDLEIDISQGDMHFPITEYRYSNLTPTNAASTVPYSNVDLFLNGYRLIKDLDYTLDFPYINICNKKYIDYTLEKQKVHVRAYGYTLDTSAINSLEVSGYVNHGVLGRNNIYDIRDDKLMSVYIDGRLKSRSSVLYAEEDNTVRVTDSKNGLPYLFTEPFISVKQVTGQDTISFYNESKAKDKRIRDFFTAVVGEPEINTFNAIPVKHTIFSPVVSKVLVDLLEGVIPRELYTTTYDDMVILTLLENNYKQLLSMDPVKLGLNGDLVNIHPHLGNTTVNVDLYQYRFLGNLIRVIGGVVNLSGYLNVSA